MSSEGNKDFLTVGLNTKEGRDQFYWEKMKASQCIPELCLEDTDWFLTSGDDACVIQENLRWLLAD